jgi:hypothetical protein
MQAKRRLHGDKLSFNTSDPPAIEKYGLILPEHHNDQVDKLLNMLNYLKGLDP